VVGIHNALALISLHPELVWKFFQCLRHLSFCFNEDRNRLGSQGISARVNPLGDSMHVEAKGEAGNRQVSPTFLVCLCAFFAY